VHTPVTATISSDFVQQFPSSLDFGSYSTIDFIATWKELCSCRMDDLPVERFGGWVSKKNQLFPSLSL
jgi:hypothetical protein